MNNFNNRLEINKINSQLKRAELQKGRLIRDIYREYEFYLNLVRNSLCISVEKGVHELCSDPSIQNVFLSANEFNSLFKKQISKLIYSKLPLITVEQLKINKIEKDLSEDINFNSFGRFLHTKGDQKEKFQYGDDFLFDEPINSQTSIEISNTCEYYQFEKYEKFASLDLDKNYKVDYLSSNHIIEENGLERQFFSALFELIEEVKVEKPQNFENHNINQFDIYSKYQSLKHFNLIDNSLENLLLNLSYKINQELFNANLIKKMISKDSFEYLVGKKMLIKHPNPFVINFEFNINQLSPNIKDIPKIIFFNISTVELEFENLNLSVHRNKINELKNQFQILIKKEKYWRQKEITLNKIR